MASSLVSLCSNEHLDEMMHWVDVSNQLDFQNLDQMEP
jgi:hypothetical protein